jgi:hypothetical protein
MTTFREFMEADEPKVPDDVANDPSYQRFLAMMKGGGTGASHQPPEGVKPQTLTTASRVAATPVKSHELKVPKRTGRIEPYGSYEYREVPPVDETGREISVANDMMTSRGGPYYGKAVKYQGKLVRFISWPGKWEPVRV